MKKLNLDALLVPSENLSIGESVLISGTILTARDAAFKRIQEMHHNSKELPIALDGRYIYFCGPSPAPQGKVIGSCGPTTADRMESYLELLLHEYGVKGFLGKGGFSKQGNALFQKYSSIYFAVVGGTGALLSERVTHCTIAAFDDLGTEAIHELTVSDFPATVAIDTNGNTLFEIET